MTLVVTNAGLAAATAANDLGIQIKITHIGLGIDGYVPDVAMTALKNEVIRKPLDFSEVVDIGHLRLGVQFDGDLVIDAKEIAYYLEDGTVFAIESRDGEVISMKRANTVVTEFFEMILKGELISAITVAVHDHPFANETTPGVIRIATAEEVATGSDDTAALTIKKMLLRRATLDQLGVTQLSNLTNGTREDRAATEKAVGEVNASLQTLKAASNPYPQYWHNDEVATNAEAIAGTTNGKILTALRGMEQLKSRISNSLTGTRGDYAASESALKQAYDKAVSAYNLANGKADAGHGHTASDVNAVETKSVHNTWYVYNNDHYCRVVILLVRCSSATTGALAGPFSLSGNLVSYRGGSNSSMSHTSVDLSVHSAYSSNNSVWTTRSNQRSGRLVTCMYGGVKYWAWDITSGNNAQDNMNYFRGFARGVDSNFFKVVRYQGSGGSEGQSTIVNAEVYNSLTVASSINPKVATHSIYHSGNKPTPEDLGAMTKWKLLKSGTCSVAAKNSATGTYVTTIDTGIAVTSRQFDPKRYKVVLANSGKPMEATDPSSCWWSAWARVLPRTRWTGGHTITFAVYCAGSGISSGTGVGQWSLYEAV